MRCFLNELSNAEPDRHITVAVQGGMIAPADHKLVELALFNLLGNAWKFTSKTKHARIDVGAKTRGGKIVYHVKDNGAGFDPNLSDKLFMPFHRLHLDREFQGTDISPAIDEVAIRRHGGTIRVEGKINEGASFFFTLD